MLEEDIIARVYAFGKLWKPHNDGFLISRMQTNFADKVTAFYTEAELCEAHPRLFDAALHLSKTYLNFGTPQVVSSLKRLYCPFHFENSEGDLATLYDLFDVKFDENYVIFEGVGYIYRDSFDELAEKDLLLLSHRTVDDVWVNNSWMNANYPTWESKYRTATELGMEPYEALRHAMTIAFSNTSLPLPGDLAI